MSTFLRNLFYFSGLISLFLTPSALAAEPPHRIPPRSQTTRLPVPAPVAGALVAAYCESTYLEGCNSGQLGLTIADFQIENTSLNHRNTGCAPKGYGDFTALSTVLLPGQTYTFVANAYAQADQGGGGNFIKQRLSIWLDSNADGTFSPEERVYPKPGASGDLMNPSLRAQFMVPATATLGPTRLRVRSREETEEYDDPCWQYFYGETHDYTINLGGSNQTTPPGQVCLELKALLEGPFVGDKNAMQTSLNQRGLLPGQTPVGQFSVKTPAGQPYNQEPWKYTGTETAVSYDADVVDWVLVSLRTKADSLNSTVYRGVGLLRSDGRVTMVTACPTLSTTNPYFIVLEHRNHLGVMTPGGVAVSGGKVSFDFSAQQSYVKSNPPTAGQLQVGGRYVMFSADGAKAPNAQNFDINYSDSDLWKRESGQFDRYLQSDFNLDADINFSDQGLWKKNSGAYSGVVH